MSSIGSGMIGRISMPITERLGGATTSSPTVQPNAPGSFSELLSSGVNQVNSMQQDAQSQVHQLLTGGDVSQVEVFTSVQKADMAFRMLVQVRNKLMAAYDEINAIRI